MKFPKQQEDRMRLIVPVLGILASVGIAPASAFATMICGIDTSAALSPSVFVAGQSVTASETAHNPESQSVAVYLSGQLFRNGSLFQTCSLTLYTIPAGQSATRNCGFTVPGSMGDTITWVAT